jgi:hypothetical protein
MSIHPYARACGVWVFQCSLRLRVEISERFRGVQLGPRLLHSRHPAVATHLDALSDHRGTAAAGWIEADVRKVPGRKRPAGAAGRGRTRRGVTVVEGTHPHLVTPAVSLRVQSVSKAPR